MTTVCRTGGGDIRFCGQKQTLIQSKVSADTNNSTPSKITNIIFQQLLLIKKIDRKRDEIRKKKFGIFSKYIYSLIITFRIVQKFLKQCVGEILENVRRQHRNTKPVVINSFHILHRLSSLPAINLTKSMERHREKKTKCHS